MTFDAGMSRGTWCLVSGRFASAIACGFGGICFLAPQLGYRGRRLFVVVVSFSGVARLRLLLLLHLIETNDKLNCNSDK